jgi:hypothetical protein
MYCICLNCIQCLMLTSLTLRYGRSEGTPTEKGLCLDAKVNLLFELSFIDFIDNAKFLIKFVIN